MKQMLRDAWQWVLHASLWIASIGLMLASSGFDGAYLASLMPAGMAWLGFVLNTTMDVTTEFVMFKFGRLQQDIKEKRKRSWVLLVGLFVLNVFSFLFGWRQVLPILRRVDPEAAQWMSMVVAAFIPTGLLVVGYTQSLLAGRIEKDKSGKKEDKSASTVPQALPAEDNVAEKVSTDERREVVLAAMLSEDPPLQRELAARFSVSRATIGNDIQALREEGKLNGGGH